MHNLRRCVLLSAAALGVALPTSFTAFPTTISSRAAASPLSTSLWAVDHTAPGSYADFQWGGLATGDLAGDGQIDLVAAYPDGVVRVFNAADGTVVWAQQTDGRISSTATLADLYGNGQQETIVTTKNGSVYVFDPHGNIAPGWPQHTVDGGPHTGFPTAFFASVAVGDLFGDKHMELTATSWDHYLYVWDSAGNWVHGFPINLADTAWVTPALIPSTVNPGGLDIIAGADSSGPPTEPYPKGGEYFRFRNTGCTSIDQVLINGGNSCQTGGSWPAKLTNTAWSSPAVFYNGSNWMTVTGSGYYYGPGAPCPDTTCGKQLSLHNADGTTGAPGWDELTNGQIMTSPAVGNLGNGDNNDVVVTSNGSSSNVGSCINGFASTGAALPGFPICNSTVWFSNPVIGPVDNSGTNGIWIGQSAWLTSYSHTGARLESIPFGDNTGYAPAAPVLFNTGSGVDVAGIGAASAAGGNYNTWRILVRSVTGSTVGHNVWPRFHGDNHADGVAQSSIAPSVPFNITAGAGDTQAALTWSVPADVGSVAPTSYSVTIYDKTSSLATGVTNPQTFTTNNGTVTGLTNGHPYFFRISASNGATSDLSPPSYSVTPVAVAAPAAATNNTVSGTSQYMLPNSDGATWQDMDPTNLAMTFTPVTPGNYLITGNADLWTSQPGYNQDIGICVYASSSTCTGANVVAWKESGGFSGIFSPNAAFVQQVVSMTPATAYTVKLVWKANKPAKGATIWAAAGAGTPFSHSRLSVRPVSTGSASTSDAVQRTLAGSDGTTWVPIDGATNLTASFTGGASQVAVLSGNADLWTANAGYNQDIGILVTGGTFGVSGTVVAWKESGGFGGTYSPNAAFVETSIPLAVGTSYTATLVWKTNKPEPAGVTVYEGAGSTGAFSPTTIVAQLASADHVQSFVNPTSAQYPLANSDGATWTEVHSAVYSQTLAEPIGSTTTCLAVISANSDLWTTNGGYNQDLGIFITGAAPVAWKESGGFAGTFSPNAAMVETEMVVTNGDPITIRWKTNKPSGTTIYAGAGNQASALGFSPTTLLVQYIGC
jgi:hypothetical protein